MEEADWIRLAPWHHKQTFLAITLYFFFLVRLLFLAFAIIIENKRLPLRLRKEKKKGRSHQSKCASRESCVLEAQDTNDILMKSNVFHVPWLNQALATNCSSLPINSNFPRKTHFYFGRLRIPAQWSIASLSLSSSPPILHFFIFPSLSNVTTPSLHIFLVCYFKLRWGKRPNLFAYSQPAIINLGANENRAGARRHPPNSVFSFINRPPNPPTLFPSWKRKRKRTKKCIPTSIDHQKAARTLCRTTTRAPRNGRLFIRLCADTIQKCIVSFK